MTSCYDTDGSLSSVDIHDDKSVTAALASALNLSEDTADRVCWAFPACADKESDMVKRGTDDTDDRCVLIDDYYKEYDASLTGIKASLDSRGSIAAVCCDVQTYRRSF